MSLTPNLTQALWDATHHLDQLQALKYINVASLTYLITDICGTLDDEVTFVWSSQWTLMKFIFLANRYSPLIDHSMAIIGFLFIKDPKACVLNWVVSVGEYVLGSWISEAILMFRTVALWRFRRDIIAVMLVLVLSMLVPMGVVMWIYVRSLTYPPRSLLDRTSCMPMIADQLGWVHYATLLVSETTVVFLTFLYWYRTSVQGDVPIIGNMYRTMYRDGTIFYVIMLAASVANMCFMFLGPRAMSSALQLPFRAVHSALCSRVLLHLRKAAARPLNTSMEEQSLTTFRITTANGMHFSPASAGYSFDSDRSMPHVRGYNP